MNLISNKKYNKSELIRLFIRRNKSTNSGEIIFNSYLSKNFKGVEINNLSILTQTSTKELIFKKVSSIEYVAKGRTKDILKHIENELNKLEFHRNFILFENKGSIIIEDSVTTNKKIDNSTFFLNSEDIYKLYLSSKTISVDSIIYLYPDKLIIYSNKYIYIIKKLS